MRKAGITDYAAFAREIVAAIPDRPISFEVFSDEFDEMERQADDDCGLGRERLRQDSDHEHAAGVRDPADRAAGASGRQAQRHGGHDAGAGARRL